MRSERVPVGSTAPAFTLPQVGGGTLGVPVTPPLPTVLLFYRGFWCANCRGQLQALREAFRSITGHGGRLVAVSTEPEAAALAALGGTPSPFPLLVDADVAVIDRYGVRDPDVGEHGPIARPAVFLLDRDGVVRYDHVGADATDRPALGAILLALESIA